VEGEGSEDTYSENHFVLDTHNLGVAVPVVSAGARQLFPTSFRVGYQFDDRMAAAKLILQTVAKRR